MHSLHGLVLLHGKVSPAEAVRDAGKDVGHCGGAGRVEHVTLAQLVPRPRPRKRDEAEIAGFVNKTPAARNLRINISFKMSNYKKNYSLNCFYIDST